MKSWVYPTAIMVILVLILCLAWGWKSEYVPVFFGGFAMLSKVFDHLILKNVNLSVEKDKLSIHRNYALRDIEKVESHVQKSSAKGSMKDSLRDLENKLLHMFDCCKDETPEKEKLKDLRGVLGNLRTQLLLPNGNKTVIFGEIARELETLRPYLEEI